MVAHHFFDQSLRRSCVSPRMAAPRYADEETVHAPPSGAAPCQALNGLWAGFVDALVGSWHAGGPTAAAQRPSGLPSARWPAVPRLLALGDLHGDYEKSVEALRIGGLVDDRLRWAAGSSWAVQVGDVLDRGASEIRILHLLERLSREAEAAGGRFVLLNGNHESMNSDSAQRTGRFRYAPHGALAEFSAWQANQTLGARLKGLCGLPAGACAPGDLSRVPPGTPAAAAARAAALCPGCPLARRFLEDRPHVVQIGSTVFAHGGLLAEHAAQGLEGVNETAAAWLRGTGEPGAAAPLPPLLGSNRAIVWSRHYSQPSESACDCGELQRALALTPGAQRVVVGHTIQGREQGINAACGGAALRIDVGMSSGCGGAPAAVLEVIEDGMGGVYRLTRGGDGRVLRELVVADEEAPAPATPVREAMT